MARRRVELGLCRLLGGVEPRQLRSLACQAGGDFRRHHTRRITGVDLGQCVGEWPRGDCRGERGWRGRKLCHLLLRRSSAREGQSLDAASKLVGASGERDEHRIDAAHGVVAFALALDLHERIEKLLHTRLALHRPRLREIAIRREQRGVLGAAQQLVQSIDVGGERVAPRADGRAHRLAVVGGIGRNGGRGGGNELLQLLPRGDDRRVGDSDFTFGNG
jgi:hypothetical protein